jgi:L,D-transpeptidase ErfK/SrfK
MRVTCAATVACLTLLTYCSPVSAATASGEPAYLGRLQYYKIRPSDSLIELARKYDLGFNEIADANPGIDPFIPKTGFVITVPTAWLPPSTTERPVVIINIPEFRLYYLPKKRNAEIITFPLGIGDQGKDTPTGTYRIIQKIPNPSWYVPPSIRAERKLPKVVPPGPKNPLGSHALRLSLPTILIHGTNRPWGIGRRSSHGCLRLYPEDIKKLYKLVPKGMRVVIVNQPLKVAATGQTVYLEAHRYPHTDVTVGLALHLLAEKKLLQQADFAKVVRAIEEKRGYPIDVTLRTEEGFRLLRP